MDAVIKPENMAEDSDDEDLEALRLAALQSIKNKPTVVAPRRRPKPLGRSFRKRPRNFHQGRVNTNLISIVPLELPLDQGETLKISDPPPLVLPQDRYCKTETKEKNEEKEISVPSKFSRFEDSNSGDSDDDYEEEYGNQSSESEKLDEGSEKNNKIDSESVLDDDELLLQDEDSLGKFFNEFDLEHNDTEPSGISSKPKRNDQNVKTGDKKDKDQSLASGNKGQLNEKSLVKRDSDSKSPHLGKRSLESQEPKQNKDDKCSSKDPAQDSSPQKEDDKRINRPCIFGRNRSPSPLVKGRPFDKFQQHSKRVGKKQEVSPKRKLSPSSPEGLSPLRKRELHQPKPQLPSAKSLHPPHYPPLGNSPREITPPNWGSRSDSSHSVAHPLGVSQEWSSSPLKWSTSNAPGTSISSPNKNISPSRQRRRSKSPIHKGSRAWDRDWSGSPQRKKSRDFDTPPDSIRSATDGSKATKRKSSSPILDRRGMDRSRSARSKDRSYSPRRVSPSKAPRRISPVRSSSRTPSLSPSPEPEGKSSIRRYKSPLRLPGYRLPNHRDTRLFRPDGKPIRKDNDRQRTIRLNGPPRKGPDSKLELPKMRPYNARLEVKLADSSPPRKSEVEKDVVPMRSPMKGTAVSSWSSDEGESDSESRFKGTDSKVVKPVVLSSKIISSTVPKARESEETSSSERRSPKRKKSKRSKKSIIKVKEAVEDPEPKEKQTNDVDLRAELSRRRAERVNKAKNVHQTVPVRLLQSAFQGLTSKSNPVDSERNSVNVFATKNEVSADASVSKKKPIHLRLGLPVARNPDPPESRLPANCPLPRATDADKQETTDSSLDGGNNRRKVKLKRSVTVQKSLSRGTTSPVTNTSGKEQVMSVSQLMLLNLAGLCPGSSYGHENPAPTPLTPLPCLSHYLAGILQCVTSPLGLNQEKIIRFTTGEGAPCISWQNLFRTLCKVF